MVPIPLLCDRMTKVLALTHCSSAVQFNDYIGCELTFNRGVSWSLFSSASEAVFWTITAVVVGITAYIAWRMHERFVAGKNITGEFLVVSGSLSNIYDRCLFGGVIDFIVVSWRTYTWPVFNCADCYIVMGVLIMIYQQWRESNGGA